MRAFCFVSVHEKLFAPVAAELRARWGVAEFSGFAWGTWQQRFLAAGPVRFDPLVVFTRDVLPRAARDEPDLGFLEAREREYGISLARMVHAERHLLAGRSWRQVMRLAEVLIREFEAALQSARPDFVFTEDISCLSSYLCFAEARRQGIPFWCVGSARLPNRLSVYASGLQRWERTNARFAQFMAGGLDAEQRGAAERWVAEFRARPSRPTGMETRARVPGLETADAGRLWEFTARWAADRRDPTVTSPTTMVAHRATRLVRMRWAAATRLYEAPAHGERYVLYPIHFQPEASTLVQAPYYLDQAALIEDLAKSLPAGHRLWVKDHLSNRGRRPLAELRRIRDTFGVRLLGPDVDGWELVRGAAAVAVITGTMGWEGLLLGKPVVTFGDVFYNVVPTVFRAGALPKDDWGALLARAVRPEPADMTPVYALVSAIRETSFPGFMKNPNTFPAVLQPGNVRAIADAIGASATGRAHPASSA
ncbi:MAG: hypothetical protein IT376_21960 [Polyangiaceae bacterium]|nr:hypothetical protein [Polyangiaceae bacterium]